MNKAPVKQFEPPPGQSLRLRVVIIAVAILSTLAVTAALVFASSEPDEEVVAGEPVEQSEQSEQSPPDDETDEQQRKLAEIFAGSAKTKKEADALISGLDEGIATMDQLLKKAEQASSDCELAKAMFEIDELQLSANEGDTLQRMQAFSEAVKAGILGREFVWQPPAETPGSDFDFTVLDESVLGEDFAAEATETGKELKEEIIKLRQRQRKALEQTRRLEVLDDRRPALDSSCNMKH